MNRSGAMRELIQTSDSNGPAWYHTIRVDLDSAHQVFIVPAHETTMNKVSSCAKNGADGMMQRENGALKGRFAIGVRRSARRS